MACGLSARVLCSRLLAVRAVLATATLATPVDRAAPFASLADVCLAAHGGLGRIGAIGRRAVDEKAACAAHGEPADHRKGPAPAVELCAVLHRLGNEVMRGKREHNANSDSPATRVARKRFPSIERGGRPLSLAAHLRRETLVQSCITACSAVQGGKIGESQASVAVSPRLPNQTWQHSRACEGLVRRLHPRRKCPRGTRRGVSRCARCSRLMLGEPGQSDLSTTRQRRRIWPISRIWRASWGR